MAMIQLGGTLCNAIARFALRAPWRINRQRFLAASSSTAASPSTVPLPSDKEDEAIPKDKKVKVDTKIKVHSGRLSVSAVFSALKNTKYRPVSKLRETSLDQQIKSATTVDNLLTIAEAPIVSRSNALHIVSILSDWTDNKKIKLVEFEGDPRFLKLCRLIVRNVQNENNSQQQKSSGDLDIIYSLTREDEAAKLVSTISLPQMIKVMSKLAQQKKRSTPLLRSLAYNISSCVENLNIKQAADLLYCMAVLSFPNEVLLQKTCSDLIEAIPNNKKSAVIGSIFTSLGLLRYKDPSLLGTLCEWVANHSKALRPQDHASLLLTLATVAYTPVNVETLLKESVESLKQGDMPETEHWLDIVWSLVVLGQATHEHVSSVLDRAFVKKISESLNITVGRKLKILNVNAAAQLISGKYKGPLLDKNSEIFNVLLERSQEKQAYVKVMIESLSNLLPSTTYLSTNIDTGMGFLLDAECYVDAKCNPVPIKQSPEKPQNATRIAVVALDYHDLCRGRTDPVGMINLNCRLLEAKGYKVLAIPHNEFSPTEKLVTRVQYLEQRIKSIVKQSGT